MYVNVKLGCLSPNIKTIRRLGLQRSLKPVPAVWVVLHHPAMLTMSWTRHLAPATLITWSPPTDTEPGPRHCLQVQLRLGSTQISRHMVTPPCHNPLLSMPSPLSPKKFKILFLAILTHCTMFYNQITFTYSRGIIICNSIIHTSMI